LFLILFVLFIFSVWTVLASSGVFVQSQLLFIVLYRLMSGIASTHSSRHKT
jgi:hypothetical protein